LRKIFDALVSGFLILLPVLVAYLLIGGFFDLVVLLTQPLADLIPRYGNVSEGVRQLAQIAILCVIFVGVGLLKGTKPLRTLGGWLELTFLGRFPPYKVMRDITAQLSGGSIRNMQPALIEIGSDAKTVGFIVEEVDEQWATVFLPFTSIPTIGSLRIVLRENIEPIDTRFADAAGWYFNWGSGTQAILNGRRSG